MTPPYKISYNWIMVITLNLSNPRGIWLMVNQSKGIDIGTSRGPKLERYADKRREILPKIGWLFLLYLVFVLCQSE